MPEYSPHYRAYHNFQCRRCAEMFHRSQVVRTLDLKWICKKCDSHDKEIAKKVGMDTRFRPAKVSPE